MKKLKTTPVIIPLILLMLSRVATASVISEDFESFSESDAITNQVAGMTFTQATVLSAGFSLNDAELPPRSGSNVVLDNGGELIIDFSSPVFAVGGYFTYLTQLTFSAYDLRSNLLGSDVSSFLNNLALSGDTGSSPNEFLGVSDASGISRVVIEGDPGGYSFVMDDLTITTLDVTPVPEPGTLFFIIAGLGAIGLSRRRVRCGSKSVLQQLRMLFSTVC